MKKKYNPTIMISPQIVVQKYDTNPKNCDHELMMKNFFE